MISAAMPRRAAPALRLLVRRGICAAATAAPQPQPPRAATAAAAATSSASASASASAWKKSLGREAAPLLRTAGVRRARFSTSAGGDEGVKNSRIWKFDEIKQMLEDPAAREKVVIIDVREPGELLESGRIPGAINIPITTAVQSFHISDQDFEDVYGFARPPKHAHLLFYCRAGVRACSAAGLAQHAGWTNVGEYPGSWLDWETHKGPVEKV